MAAGDPSRPVTIAYIAESAGVSVPTVSKVINGRSGVSADTRARVEDLINRHKYRKPVAAHLRGIYRDFYLVACERELHVVPIRRFERHGRRSGALAHDGLGTFDDPTWADGKPLGDVARDPPCAYAARHRERRDDEDERGDRIDAERAHEPLVPLSLFRIRSFTVSVWVSPAGTSTPKR